jgi:hypothetical protein
VKGGSGLVYLTKGDTDFVYCLKGSRTSEFYAYWVEMDSWLDRKPAPIAPSGRGMNKGSCIAYDNDNTIYALKAKYNEFYTYDVAGDSWMVKPIMPWIGTTAKKKKVKDGAAMAYNGSNLVYAFKGGNTYEFWAYVTEEDTWLAMDPVPPGLNKKKVKKGASLCWAASFGRIYGFKGGNTNELWMYSAPPTVIAGKSNSQEGAMSSPSAVPTTQSTLNIIPNPFTKTAIIKYELAEPDNIIFKLFDATGKLVQIVTRHTNSKAGTVKLNSDKLPVGVYILRLEGRNRCLTKKVIISG